MSPRSMRSSRGRDLSCSRPCLWPQDAFPASLLLPDLPLHPSRLRLPLPALLLPPQSLAAASSQSYRFQNPTCPPLSITPPPSSTPPQGVPQRVQTLLLPCSKHGPCRNASRVRLSVSGRAGVGGGGQVGGGHEVGAATEGSLGQGFAQGPALSVQIKIHALVSSNRSFGNET